MQIRQRLFGLRAAIGFAKSVWPLVLLLRDNVDRVMVTGDGLKRLSELRGKRAIICPNHASEADGDVMFMLSRLTGEAFHYVAAHELFATYRELYGLLMTLCGCYAIRRGGTQAAPLKVIRDDLVRGENKLVIFPEGELSHDFTSLLPLEPGAVQLAFWAIEDLRQQHKDEPVFIVPVAISYAFSRDPAAAFDIKLRRLERRLGMPEARGVRLEARLKAIVERLLNALESEYNCPADGQSIDRRLALLRQTIRRRLTAYLGLAGISGGEVAVAHKIKDVLERARQRAFGLPRYVKRLKKDRALLAVALDRDLQRMMNLRMCLAKCTGTYGDQEISETLYLLEREVLGKPLAMPRRRALIAIGEPIDLRDWTPAYDEQHRQGVIDVNHELERRMHCLQKSLLAVK